MLWSDPYVILCEYEFGCSRSIRAFSSLVKITGWRRTFHGQLREYALNLPASSFRWIIGSRSWMRLENGFGLANSRPVMSDKLSSTEDAAAAPAPAAPAAPDGRAFAAPPAPPNWSPSSPSPSSPSPSSPSPSSSSSSCNNANKSIPSLSPIPPAAAAPPPPSPPASSASNPNTNFSPMIVDVTLSEIGFLDNDTISFIVSIDSSLSDGLTSPNTASGRASSMKSPNSAPLPSLPSLPSAVSPATNADAADAGMSARHNCLICS